MEKRLSGGLSNRCLPIQTSRLRSSRRGSKPRRVAKKDVDSFAKYYTDDASVLMPNSPILNGKEAIRGALKPMLADPNFALTFQSSRVEASKGGDFVHTRSEERRVGKECR